MNKTDRIFVAGHQGLVGSALLRRLTAAGYTALITRTRAELDLTCQAAVSDFFNTERPQYVFLAAAKVGGILANDTAPFDFLRDNVLIQSHVIESAYRCGVHKLLFLGSSCIYPRLCPQPMKEEYLLTGALEPTNEWYAIAKIAGLKLCQALRRQHGFDAISAMPTNLYGPNDNFSLTSSHVLPALVRKFCEAEASGASQVTVWGSGTPRREFLHVDDLASALIFLMEHYSEAAPINVGWGEDVSVGELAYAIKAATGFQGEIVFDATKPDGTPRKLLDVSRLQTLGWRPTIALKAGLQETVAWYRAHRASA